MYRDQPHLTATFDQSQIKATHYNKATIQVNDQPGIPYNGHLSSPESSCKEFKKDSLNSLLAATPPQRPPDPLFGQSSN